MSQFNINRPRRVCFNEWMNLAKQLSGQTDVSKNDMIRRILPPPSGDDMLHRMEQVVLAKDPMRLGERHRMSTGELTELIDVTAGDPNYANDYAADECASGAYNPNDPAEV